LKTLLIAKGLHPPWATGEVSYTKGLLGSLARISGNEISVVYTIDKHRIINAREGDWTADEYPEGSIADRRQLEENSPRRLKERVLQTVKTMASENYDTVHVAYQGLTPFEINNCHLTDKLVVKHIYGPAPSYGAAISMKLVYTAGFIVQRARETKVSFPSVFSAGTYWMKSNKQTVIIPPAIDTAQFSPQKKPNLESLLPCLQRSQFKFGLENLPASSKVILYMGWLVPERFPYEIVLRAFKKHLERSPHTYLLVIGRQSEKFYGEAQTAERIVSLARGIEVEKNIGVSLVELTQPEKLALINTSDLIIYPFTTSRLNPSVVDPPLSILENMASGRPVLATAVISIPDLIQDGSNGFILNKLTVDSLADSLDRAMAPETSVSNEARKTIVSRFSLETIANLLANLRKGDNQC
jgi:glycosyltransferase involved in cell wall biosynthesis